MAPSIRAPATYKKQDGTISITKDQQLVLWAPSTPPGSAPTLKIIVTEIDGLAKSPAASARVSAKISMKAGSSSGVDSYVFGFTSASARAEQELIVETLRVAVQEHKMGNSVATPNPQAVASPAAQSFIATSAGNGTSSTSRHEKSDISDADLLTDVTLQQSLLAQNPPLRQRFEESMRKVRATEVIPLMQFSKQFWSPRLHLLRAHAVERNQSQGTYNVLSEVKTKRDHEGTVRLNLSKEQIQLIFEQHPLVTKIYNDLVPGKWKEGEFWANFFVSKLFKQLKGENITELDGAIPELDKYLGFDEASDRGKHFEAAYIPRVLDLEGNEQDHPGTQGNAPDKTMYFSKQKRQALLRILNSMSEKMMANVTPFDKESLNAPAGMDEATFEEMRLRDLQAQDPDSRLLLNISSDQRFFQQSTPQAKHTSKSKMSTKDVIKTLRDDISDNASTIVELDESAKRQAASSSKTMLKSIKQRLNLSSTTLESELGLSKSVIDTITMTNNTTVEFLHYFWTAYLSGDEARAAELVKLVEALDKSIERIDAVADEAEVERRVKRDELRKKQEEYYQRTGRRMKQLKDVEGGREAVKRLVQATEGAISFAESEYQRAVAEQTAQLSATT